MTVLSPKAVYNLARDAGLGTSQAVTATAIAIAESGLRTDAQGDVGIQTSKWGPSVGLWQIRSLKAESGTGRPRDATRLEDPQFNARSMVSISSSGKSFNAWSTYKDGAYKTHLGQVTSGNPLLEAAGNAVEAITGAGAAAVAAVNPFDNWAPKATLIGLEIVLVVGGISLVVLGTWRLVIPAALSGVNKLTEAVL